MFGFLCCVFVLRSGLIWGGVCWGCYGDKVVIREDGEVGKWLFLGYFFIVFFFCLVVWGLGGERVGRCYFFIVI